MSQRSTRVKGVSSSSGSSSNASLRELILSNDLAFLMEVHDGLSAAIATQAGFKGLWASGLSISSSLGYRDANEASWTQLVDVHDIPSKKLKPGQSHACCYVHDRPHGD